MRWLSQPSLVPFSPQRGCAGALVRQRGAFVGALGPAVCWGVGKALVRTVSSSLPSQSAPLASSGIRIGVIVHPISPQQPPHGFPVRSGNSRPRLSLLPCSCGGIGEGEPRSSIPRIVSLFSWLPICNICLIGFSSLVKNNFFLFFTFGGKGSLRCSPTLHLHTGVAPDGA